MGTTMGAGSDPRPRPSRRGGAVSGGRLLRDQLDRRQARRRQRRARGADWQGSPRTTRSEPLHRRRTSTSAAAPPLAVGLPVPPGTIAKQADGTNMFASLRFTAVGSTSLPPVDPAELVAGSSGARSGHRRLRLLGRQLGPARRQPRLRARESAASVIFDHGRTLLRTPSGDGRGRDRRRGATHSASYTPRARMLQARR